MTHVDHHYVLNRHNSGPTMQLLPDYRNMLITRRLDDILYLIPLSPFDNIYGRQAALSYVAARLATFTVTNNNHWRYLPFREYNASLNPVDQLIDHSQRFYPTRLTTSDKIVQNCFLQVLTLSRILLCSIHCRPLRRWRWWITLTKLAAIPRL